jgi:hypothetical protein
MLFGSLIWQREKVRSSRWRFFKVIEGEHVFQTQFIAKEEN